MNQAKLNEMFGGWFVGNFSPTAFKTGSCEVAAKHYQSGDTELSHFHKVATEITLILSGRVRMCDKEWDTGNIIVLSPGEATSFEAITDAITVVVKIPGVANDKFISEG
jgi:hypothetical protein